MAGGPGVYDEDLRRGLDPAQLEVLETHAGEEPNLTATLADLAAEPEEQQALRALERHPYDSLGAEQVLDIARRVLAGRG
jgi:hypothetical protein